MPAPESLRTGYEVKNYALLEELGRGGEALVWSAWDKYHQRVVAIKLIPTTGTEPALISADFERQVHLIASLAHPHILPLYEFGATSDYYFFAMRYASGGTLSDLLKQGELSLEKALCLTADIVSALEYLHGNRVVHRDLKPSNILLDAQGRAYVADFGLARRLTEDTVALHTGRGTTYYAPPEQHSRSVLTPSSDIYSLGVLLYEMLTGSLPELNEEGLADVARATTQKLSRPHHRLERIAPVLNKVHVLAAAEPAQRPQNARAAFDLLLQDVPPSVVTRIPYHRRARREAVSEDELLATDARTLLHRLVAVWQPGEPFPADLTHFAYIDSAFMPGKDGYSNLTAQGLEFLLHGALLHGHNYELWWQRVPDADLRLRVCEQIMTSAEGDAPERALLQLVDNPDSTLPYRSLSQKAVDTLIDMAVRGRTSAARGNALMLLERWAGAVERWQPVAFSDDGDARLARLALGESPFARQAARLIGQVRSERGVRALLEGVNGTQGEASARQFAALQEVRAAAGGLPPWTPLSVRARGTFQQIREQFLEDRAVLSWSRALIGVIGAGLVATVMLLGLFSRPNRQMRDILYQPYTPSGVVTIVEIDDETLARYGRWGDWPRSLHAELIEQLDAAGADAIVLDFAFLSQSAQDEQLADAMREAGNVVHPMLGQGDAFHITPGPLQFQSSLQPEPVLAEAAAAIGHTNFRHDEDGYVRRLPLIAAMEDGTLVPNLALAAVQVYLGEPAGAPVNSASALQAGSLGVVGREIPVNPWGEMFVHYAGPPARPGAASFTTVSYEDVLEGRAPEGIFEDKLVLVGITATAEPDRYLTPVSEEGRLMYGVEILANAVETIWSGRFIVQPALGLRLLILLVLGAGVALLCTRPLTGILASIGTGTLYFLVASWLFDYQGILLDLFFPFLTIALTYALVTAYRFGVEARARRQLMSLFETRVTPRVARETLTAVRQGRINLDGQMQEISVMQARMRGYSGFVAMHTAGEVLEMLNAYLNLFVEAIFENEGTVIRTSGDEVIAVFNAPLPQPDHALLATRTAWESSRRIRAYHDSLPAEHPHRGIEFSFGVATGRAVVGYTGAGNRYTYTALGETLDLSARLAQAAAPGEVLVAGATYRASAGRVMGQMLNPITSRGIAEPTSIYSVKTLEAHSAAGK